MFATELKNFLENTSGAATVDWVVVAAVMVGLVVAIQDMTMVGLVDRSSDIRSEFQGGLFETAWDAHLAVPQQPGATSN